MDKSGKITADAIAPLRVFVYGTLKPGEFYYPTYCAEKVVAAHPAIALGNLFDLPLGYPAMTVGDRPVKGVVLTFADWGVLKQLDELEGFDPNAPAHVNEYIRQEIEVMSTEQRPFGTAWVYLMLPDAVQRLGGTLLEEGYWTGR